MPEVLHDGVVQRLIAFFLADLNHARDLVRFSLAHEIGDGGVDDQDLKGRDASRFVDAFEKILRDDALERLGQGSADLVLLGGREDVDDTIDRLGGIGGVQCAENEVTGSGRG